jgi:hypothetical protein
MEFRDYAAKETSGLFGRLLASQTEASVQHVRALREALDAAAAGIEADASKSQAEQEIQELIRRLNTAAGTAARAASQKAQKEAQVVIDGLNEDLKAQRAETDRLAAAEAQARADAEAQAQTLRAEIQKETDRADAADRDLDAAIEAHAQVDAARVEAEAALRQQSQARSIAEKDLGEVRGVLDQTVAEAARLTSELDAARGEIASGAAALASTRADAERAQRETIAALDAAKRALEGEREQNEQLATMLAEAQAQAEMARADLTDAQAQIDAIRASLAKETERADAADRDLDAAIEAHTAVDAARLEAETLARQHGQAKAAVEKELAEVRGLLDASVSQAARAAMELDATLAENKTLAADLSAAQGEIDAAHAQREAITAQLEASRARIQTLERNQASHHENLHRLEAGLNDALQAEASARELAANAEVDVARSQADMAALRADVDRLGSLMDASMHAVDELAGATTISDMLASLVRQLSVEFSRVALFRVKGNRLEGEYQIGFDQTTDVTKLVLPISMDSLITRAAASGAVEDLRGSELDDSSRAPFGGSPTPTFALALPVIFQGETFAVVYADSDQETSSGPQYDAGVGFAKLMVKTSTVLLMRLSQELKTLNELRDYAAMLLQEAEEMYSADLQSERTEEERRSRLQDTVECARQLYAQRAALEGAAAATLLDDRIAAVLESDLSTPFASDLAAIAGTIDRFADARRTAAS